MVTGYSLSIYHWWRGRVDFSRNREEGWDGSFKGGSAEMGTYMYVAEVELGDQRRVHRY